MRTPNVFNILLRSANSENNTTPQSCNYNLGSVLQNAPNLINFQKYFKHGCIKLFKKRILKLPSTLYKKEIIQG